MTDDALIDREIRARAALDAAPEGEPTLAAHREWAEARAALRAHVLARGFAGSRAHRVLWYPRCFGGIARAPYP